MKKNNLIAAIIISSLPVGHCYAGWSDLLEIFSDEQGNTATVANLSNADIVSGLKEALIKGSQSAVNSLGREDGFLKHPQLKIPIPEKLKPVESGLRKLKQDELADEFILSMNRAAEQAVPEAVAIFSDSIRNMTIEDARGILQGPDTAATDYLRETGGERLTQRFLPIVKQATDKVGVTGKYKSLIDGLGPLANFIDTNSLDIDSYVTDKAVDGLFSLVAREEKLIRENPAARTTDLLQKVFSAN